ncbi:MAG: SbcD_Mre11, partial [uncultured Gemmatimonadetes bacterium]
ENRTPRRPAPGLPRLPPRHTAGDQRARGGRGGSLPPRRRAHLRAAAGAGAGGRRHLPFRTPVQHLHRRGLPPVQHPGRAPAGGARGDDRGEPRLPPLVGHGQHPQPLPRDLRRHRGHRGVPVRAPGGDRHHRDVHAPQRAPGGPHGVDGPGPRVGAQRADAARHGGRQRGRAEDEVRHRVWRRRGAGDQHRAGAVDVRGAGALPPGHRAGAQHVVRRRAGAHLHQHLDGDGRQGLPGVRHGAGERRLSPGGHARHCGPAAPQRARAGRRRAGRAHPRRRGGGAGRDRRQDGADGDHRRAAQPDPRAGPPAHPRVEGGGAALPPGRAPAGGAPARGLRRAHAAADAAGAGRVVPARLEPPQPGDRARPAGGAGHGVRGPGGGGL